MSKKLKTNNNPEGRNWPDEIVLDVGSNMPMDVYGIRDNGWGVRYVRHDVAAKRAAAFYREQLELICKDSRKTRARRLAESALMFWDQLQLEAAKREKAANAERSNPAPKT